MCIPTHVLDYFVVNLIYPTNDADSRLHTYLTCILDAIIQNRSLLNRTVNGKTVQQHIIHFALRTYFDADDTADIPLWVMTDDDAYGGNGAYNLSILTKNTTKQLLRFILSNKYPNNYICYDTCDSISTDYPNNYSYYETCDSISTESKLTYTAARNAWMRCKRV